MRKNSRMACWIQLWTTQSSAPRSARRNSPRSSPPIVASTASRYSDPEVDRALATGDLVAGSGEEGREAVALGAEDAAAFGDVGVVRPGGGGGGLDEVLRGDAKVRARLLQRCDRRGVAGDVARAI